MRRFTVVFEYRWEKAIGIPSIVSCRINAENPLDAYWLTIEEVLSMDTKDVHIHRVGEKTNVETIEHFDAKRDRQSYEFRCLLEKQREAVIRKEL